MESIKPDYNKEKLKNNLEKYLKVIKHSGANRASIINASRIPVKESVVLKCRIPRCFSYGTSVNCPPYALKPAELKKEIKKFHQAIFFSIDVSTEILVRKDELNTMKRREFFRKIFKIVSDIENKAFYDGYYLAFGFAAGSCRHILCGKEECLALHNKSCRHPLLARPSMEAVGIDVFRMAADEGWGIFPIGKGTDPETVPMGMLTGVVIIA